MSLLPKKTGVRRFAGGGALGAALGYVSQLGAGLGSAAGKAGDALYQALPPLAVPYVAVKEAAPVDTAAAVAAADAEGQKQADALLKDLDKKLADSLKDARMTAAGAAEWSRASGALMRKIHEDVSRNPAALSNPTYRTQLALDTQRLLDPGQFNSKRNTYDGYNSFRGSSKEQLNDRAIINGVRQVETNDQLIKRGLTESNLALTMQRLGVLPAQATAEELAQLEGRDLSGELLEKIQGGIQEGTFADVEAAIGRWRTAISPSERSSSGKSEYVGNIKTQTGPEERILSGGGSRTDITNAARYNELKQAIQRGGWQAALGNPKAVAGMYKAMNDRVDNTALRSDVRLSDGTVLPAGTNRYQAEQEAYKRGDLAQYRYLMGKREELVKERALDYLNQELDLGLVDTTRTSSESGIGGKTGEPAGGSDGAGALDFWGQFKTGHAGLDSQTVSLNNPDGEYVLEKNPFTGREQQVWKPSTDNIQVTLLPRKEKLEMDSFLKTGTGDQERRKTLAEFTGSSVLAAPGRPLYTGNKWAGGMDPGKFEVVAHEGMTRIVEPGQEANLAAMKSYGQTLDGILAQKNLTPGERQYYQERQRINEQAQKIMLQPYHIVRVSSDIRSYSPINPLLKYKSKTGKETTPILGEPNSRFIMPNIAGDNPYGLTPLASQPWDEKSDDYTDRGHTGYSSIGNDQAVTMRVYVRDENTVSNDASKYRSAGNDLVGNIKNYVNAIQAEQVRLQGGRPALK